jgi:hypothetical protein
MSVSKLLSASVAAAVLAVGGPAAADGLLGTFDLKGSFGETGGHKRYVPSIANPVFNETPYITTELRAIYMHQDLPKEFLTGGGNIDMGAAQIRIAITDRLGFIATKDGYADLHFKRGLPDEEGFANLAAGLKYAVISDPKTNTILTVGAEYEAPTGNLKTGGISLQGKGDGFIDLFVTGATTFDKLGFQASIGTNLALDNDHDSSMLHYSANVNYEVLPNFFPMIELNGFTTIDKGRRTVANFEGMDLVNFGSTDSGTVVTAAVGARYRFNENVMVGIGYERPVTDREDLLNWRVYADLVIRY